MIEPRSAHDRLIKKLQSITNLSRDDAQALRTLPTALKTLEENADVVREGDRPSQCCILVEGFLCRYIMTPRGTRQITSLHLPGDMPDLQSLHLDVMDHSVGVMARSTVAFVPHVAVRDLAARHPAIANALWRDTLVDAAIFREWVVNLGARSAYQRGAHLMCEVFYKARAVGVSARNSCAFPLTQQELGDAMGISTVHVNRTIQKLRGEKLITLSRDRLTILDLKKLAVAGEFNPNYLHLNRRPAHHAEAFNTFH